MNNLDKQPWYTSLLAIVIAMICFWPVGCVFLYLRWVKRDGRFKAINNVLLVCTVFLLLVGVPTICSSIEYFDTSDILADLFIFIIPGIICGYIWFKRRKKVKEYNKYLEYISAHKKIKIDNICNNLNVDYKTATSAIADMINKGMIKGYIEEDELIIKGSTEGVYNISDERTPVKKETKIVKCKECGAKNTVIVGEKKECEYCGSLLQ